MRGPVARRFGTFRGLVRLALSYPEVALGHAAIVQPHPARVQRLVFVCHGNICRSAFADVLARRRGLNAISFGLSTSTGLGAHGPALAAAAVMGVDLAVHRTSRAEDYVPQPGDLLLAMEARQLRRLKLCPRFDGLPRTLLGYYARPCTPHLHDPYGLDEAYMATCFGRIASAVTNLQAVFPGARAGG